MGGSNPCLDHACSKCCHDTEMMLAEADVARLEAAGHQRADFSVKDAEGFLRLRNVGGRCFFLRDDGRCGVHEMRPEGCRLYPLVYDEKWGPVMDVDCPFTRLFVQTPEAEDALLRLVERLQDERDARRGLALHGRGGF